MNIYYRLNIYITIDLDDNINIVTLSFVNI